MRQTRLSTKTRREAPKDEVAKNAQLLIRGGYVDKLSSGLYTFLPLGLRVIRKIEAIIREEMNAVGAQEILMPALHPKDHWATTGRWETMDDLYKLQDSSGRDFALGATHEEIVTPLAKDMITSYRDLPFSLYQFQTKFRMEMRAKSGILRGREFIMKDLYSFHADEQDLQHFYKKMHRAYERVFERVGIGALTYFTYASGGSFAKYSHEFQMLTGAGEDVIYICDTCRIAINQEVLADQPKCPQCGASEFRKETSIEVGNIFELKTKYSAPFELRFTDEKGEERPVQMGCYGIGLGRVMGAAVEAFADEKGIVWPASIAPFSVHLLNLSSDDKDATEDADTIYHLLKEHGIEVLFDDRPALSAGQKFADADLLGIPHRIVVSKKTVADRVVEYKSRTADEARRVTKEELLMLVGR